MTDLLHDLIVTSTARSPKARAVEHKDTVLSYEQLHELIQRVSGGLRVAGLKRLERVAVYLPKSFEVVGSIFGTSLAGGVFVPINPLLKAAQVEHILRDCNVRVLVTSGARARDLREVLPNCPDLRLIVTVDEPGEPPTLPATVRHATWSNLIAAGPKPTGRRNIDADMAAIFYTSGSTGRPKGVVLSHRNMVTGAESVAQYLANTPDDRLLAVLPFSFDAGFSQMSTAFRVGASVTLMEYLFARDVIAAVARSQITGLAGVPPLWSQIAGLEWPATVHAHLRYLTNTGGSMPGATLSKLRRALPQTRIFLMYGLTEAFRSTYLPPEQLDQRPDSIGKAIPNAEILVVRPDGTECAADEPGELVHRGSLVALGYWNDPEKTAERFKPVPGQPPELVLTELAVWSGDTVRRDEEGYLYFVGRKDEMIKTSGYRVSPTEVEEAVFATGLVSDAAAVGVRHATLGQAIVVVASPAPGLEKDTDKLLAACKASLPTFMVPAHIDWRDTLPRNPNGKYDRPRLAAELKDLFAGRDS